MFQTEEELLSNFEDVSVFWCGDRVFITKPAEVSDFAFIAD